MSEIRKRTIQGLQTGDTFKVARTVTENEMVRFADVTRDYNPIHFDDRFSGVKNFKGRICHGLMIASLITEVGGQIGWLASGMNFRFIRPVYFGDTIQCEMTITKIDEKRRAEANAVYRNHAGEVVLEAELTGILPGEEEKRVLKAMVEEGDPTNRIDE